jgi:hypothetical protein
MTLSMAQALAGIPHNERGALSRHAYVQAVGLASLSFPVLPAHGLSFSEGVRELATTDFSQLRRIYDLDAQSGDHCDWHGSALPNSGLIAIRFANARDVRIIATDLCNDKALPATWTIERDGDGTFSPFVLVFARALDTPNLAYDRPYRGSSAQAVKSFVLPGVRHRESSQCWRWRQGCHIGTPLIYFPWNEQWPLAGTNGISAAGRKRVDCTPRMSLRSRNAPDNATNNSTIGD